MSDQFAELRAQIERTANLMHGFNRELGKLEAQVVGLESDDKEIKAKIDMFERELRTLISVIARAQDAIERLERAKQSTPVEQPTESGSDLARVEMRRADAKKAVAEVVKSYAPLLRPLIALVVAAIVAALTWLLKGKIG